LISRPEGLADKLFEIVDIYQHTMSLI